MAEHAVPVLEFSDKHQQLAFLSNFYAQDVRIPDDQFPDDDIVYHSAEAYFQAQKYASRVNARDIKKRSFAGPVTPIQAKRRGGKRGIRMMART